MMYRAFKGVVGRKKGFHHSEETKKKLSEVMKGKHWKLSEQTKRNISKARKGMRFSEKHRKKMSESRKGEKCYKWKGGITPEIIKIRNGVEIRLWRESVFARDNYTCQACEKRGVRLNVHHIKNFAEYPELRFAIDNGITLCKNCHKKAHREILKS